MTRPRFGTIRVTGARQLVLAFCGPDGAGKTTLVHKLGDALANHGFVVHTGYCYGCLICRRIDRPSRVPGATPVQSGPPEGPAPAAPASTTPRAPWRGRLAQLLRTVHGYVDAYELVVRLLALRLAATWGTSAVVVVTDRGPLDGLAKHDPPRRSQLARRYLRLAPKYDLIVLLDAPADLLAHRDGEHCTEELEHWRALYRRWADVTAATGNEVLVVDTVGRAPDSIALDLCRIVISAQS
jgi:ribose 1,5-bisphosphokinase PhnN